MGVEISAERLAELTVEAEAGYDVAALKTRGRGRPGRGADPSQVIAVRLTEDELRAVDDLARARHQTRSAAIREALAAATATG